MHIFLEGESHVGKTTLIHKLLENIPQEKVYGFYTQKVSVISGSEETGGIYIFSARQRANYNYCIATFNTVGCFNIDTSVFETYGLSLLSSIPEGSIVVMDELGFLENNAPKFCEQVLKVLDEKVTVIGVVKRKNTAFLNKVRRHPFVQIYAVTKENREAVLQDIKRLLEV